MLRATGVLMAAVMLSAATSPAQGPTGLIEFSLTGKTQLGLELMNFGKESVVIGRDGSLHSLDPVSLKRLDGRYEPLSSMEMRNELRSEFGPEFEVVATRNFLVVQPRGRGNKWPELFETSHRGFITYMSRHGVTVRTGRFPMVAIVFPDSRSMYAEFKKQKLDVSRVAGIYSNNSNRVITHDGGNYEQSVATIRHEAAHQSGFNSGVHSRVNDTPRWITEGIGQLFEPAAVGSQHQGGTVQDRINHDSLRQLSSSYLMLERGTFAADVRELVSDDKMFEDASRVGKAYAASWAIMFYLAERQPSAFAKILNHTASRKAFETYRREDRLKDFERIVGSDLFEFTKRVGQYHQQLK